MELRVEKLCKSYGGQTVLRDVTFEAHGGVTCIMAPSGSGKTTLLRILLGLEKADGGTVTPGGARWAAVFQEDRLLDQLSALDNLRFVLGAEFREEEARTLLAELGLDDVGGKRVRDFSGGMKRRLALARALLVPADILALDEPFAGLDEENRTRAIACIRKYAAGKTVLLVTHDETDAVGLEARIIQLK